MLEPEQDRQTHTETDRQRDRYDRTHYHVAFGGGKTGMRANAMDGLRIYLIENP